MFSSFLRKYREKTGVTQIEFVSEIQKFHELFKSLDEITLSRWENGRTKPSKKKQIIILLKLGCLELFHDMYCFDSNSITALNELLSKRYRGNFNNSDSPYLVGKKYITISKHKGIPESRLAFYLNYFEMVHRTSCKQLTSLVLSQALNEIEFYEFYSDDKVLLGHFMALDIRTEAIKRVLSDKINRVYDFSNEDGLYIISCYASSYNVFIYHLKIILEVIINCDGIPKHLFVKCFLNEMTVFYESIGGIVVANGPDSRSGVRFKGKTYQWLLYKINVVNMLGSKIFVYDANITDVNFIQV